MDFGVLAPSGKEIPSDKAAWLFETGSFLIVLDMPIGSEFGIDYNSWETGNKFKGIKMIPPGFHYIHYSAKNKNCQAAPRTGMMKFIKPQEFYVTRWNEATEELCDVPGTSDVVESLKANKKELDRFLGAYPYESLEKWMSLTNFITSECVDRVRPVCGNVYSASTLESKPSNSQSRMQAQKKETLAPRSFSVEDANLPDMKPIPGTELRFIHITERSFLGASAPSDITTLAMDNSQRLEELFGCHDNLEKCDLILSELQVSFVCFLVGQVYEAFEQWKQLVGLLCNCVSAIEKYPELFSKFIGVLHYHIREIPEDFFVDIVSKSNFLSVTLASFFENVQVSNCPKELKSKGKKFRNNLEKRFKWSFECETGEYAPVVVELK